MPDEENGTPLSQETAVDNGRDEQRDSDVRHEQQEQQEQQQEQQQQQPDDTQEKPPTAKDSNPPPAPPPKKKLFTSLNVNQKFLSKSTTPAPTPGPQKQQNGRQASPVPIPSTSRQLSTKLHTMPISKPSVSPNPPPSSTHSSPWAKPSVPTPSSSAASTLLHQPAPTRPGINASIPTTSAAAPLSGTSGSTGTAARNVWRMGGLGLRSGMTTEFPTAKEAADGQKAAAQAAALAAQVQAAHNQAIIQELDTFTRLEPHSHRWDEEDEEDDMIDFPDVPHTSPPARPPPQLPSTDDQPQQQQQQQPVSKSDRFAEDFDRSWPPRRSGGGGGDDGRSKDNTNEKVLFNASSNRLESRPEQQQTRLDTGKSSERERGWGPKLLGREMADVPASGSASGLGGKRSLPPHLSVTNTSAAPPAPGAPAGEGPSAASGSWRSSAPARPAWSGSRPTPSSGAGGGGGGGMGEQRQSWESRNDERERERERDRERDRERERAVGSGSGISGQGRRSFNAGQPPRSLYTHPPPHTLPPPTSTAAPLAPASSTTSTDPDPQSLEMHTAAEKARLRRLEEEKEREAAKERARMKAKALEEKLKAAQPESQQQQQQLTIAQRPPPRDGGGVPPRTTSSEMDKPSRAESEPSWRARAQPPPPPPPPPAAPAAAVSEETPQLPTEEEKEEKVTPPLYDATGLGASTSPSPESAQQPTSSSSAATATATATATAQQQPALSSSSFDGMLARVKAAMLEMQQTREKEVREKELEKEREKEGVKQVQVEEKMPAKEEVEKRHVLKASRAEHVKEEKAKPMTTTTTTTTTTPKATSTSQTPNQTSQPPSSKPPTVSSAPAAEHEPPQFFDITYPQPPRSPPPAWRTYNIRLPKPSSLPRPRCFDLPAISSSQQTKWEKGVAAPKGWARTFEPPLENEETIEDVLDRAKMLLPHSRVVTKVGEIVVSISPRVLERVKERRTGVDGEVKEGREKRRAEKIGRSVVEEEEGEGEEEVRTGVEKAAVLLESSTKPVQAPAPVPPTTTSSTAQQQQPPPRRKSPVKSAAQAEKDPSTFILQGVGLAIAPPPHISLSSLPASSVSGSTSRDGKDGSFSLLSEDGKPGVRFMVSSELEGDSLLEEVNKMSLESVEEAKGEKNDDKEEIPTTPPLAHQSPKSNGPSTPWSKTSLAYPSQPHDAIKSVWGADTSATTSDTPMYPTLNAPVSTETTQPLATGLKSGFPTHAHSSSSGPQFSPNLPAANVPFTRHPSQSQIQSPYFGSPHHTLSSPPGDPSMGMTMPLGGYNRQAVNAMGVAGVNGFQQGVWGGFGVAPGYGYTPQPQHAAHQANQGQQKFQQYTNVPPYSRVNPNITYSYAPTPSPSYSHPSPQVRPQGRFAQAATNGDYRHHPHQGQGTSGLQPQPAGFGMSMDGSNQGYYGGIGMYSPQAQHAVNQGGLGQVGQSQGQGQQGYGRGMMRGGMGRKMW
ncbi:hypothetical protein D1P53_000147 [Cryptococcus gattii VGV]|nr:hypothetical protein D1P53_000147 [Cryptococcus gattii VGV]